MEELAIKVKNAVEKERDRSDAVLVFPSMSEVMRLNKLGTFSMSQLGQSKSPFFQLFKKKKQGAGFADQMLKLVRTLPKFWLGGSPDNLVNFVKMISGSYIPALKGEYLNWYGARRDASQKLKSANAPVVGLVRQRSHIVTGDESHYVAVIMELEARGAKVVLIFAGGIDFSGPVEKYFIDPITKKPMVNSVESLTGFALVGGVGAARQDHPRAIEVLMKLNVPYIVAVPLVFQTTEEWLNSTLGLHPIQVALQVSLPELDGGMEPIVFAGRDPRTGKYTLLLIIIFIEAYAYSLTTLCLSPTLTNFLTLKSTILLLNMFSNPLCESNWLVDSDSTFHITFRKRLHRVQPTFGYEGNHMRLLFSKSASPHHGFAAYNSYVEKIFGADTVLHIGTNGSLGTSRAGAPNVERINVFTNGSLEFMPGKQVGMSDVCFP
ncbi:hypothetical protein LIER_10316 [Lithospermum erythrorhizon]|uniref:magnesium chelatase n=1 Tax=Lithospermum erythrorhizon TaxID=34254 RepID=A0AAV3PK36_LITER